MMKLINFFLACCLMSFTTFSQVNVTKAIDFAVIGTRGETHNLFNYLNEGNYVILSMTLLG
jgi:hypothetical protein